MTDLRMMPIEALLSLAMNKNGALLGSNPASALGAVAHAMPPYGTPDMNIEALLTGEPGFDLHVRCSHRHFHGQREGQPGPFWLEHPQLLAWAHENLKDGEGMGVSYDLRGRGGISVPDPAVYLRGSDVEGFFAALGRHELFARYVSSCGRLPKGWRCWYTGSFANRQGSPLRLGIIVSRVTQDRYVGNPTAFAADLAQAGAPVPEDKVLSFVAEHAALPYAFDIELDVDDRGCVRDPVGINLTLSLACAEARAALDGPLAPALVRAEELGLADDRWRLLVDATFRKLLTSVPFGTGGSVACANKLVYLKLRLEGGRPLDAKAYFQTQWHQL